MGFAPKRRSGYTFSLMCCFSGPVRSVSGTRIFARPLADGRQLLVYAMSLAIDDDVAMVLPIPVPPGSADDAVRFVDMSRAPLFFDALDSLFPQPMGGFGPPPQAAPLARAAAPLVVHDVGDFEASFVPSQRDFQRLDRRFRLEPEVWAALPQYRDWGFAVFKLRSARSSGIFEGVKRLLGSAPSTPPQKRHPMAFEFPRRDPTTLFYPAVHVHDGHVHARARFDHTFYGQEVEAAWEATLQPASGYGLPDEVKTSLRLDATVQRFRLQGDHPNEDVVVRLARTL